MRRRYVALALVALTFPILAACGNDDAAEPSSSAFDTSANCPAFEGVPAVPGTFGVAPKIGKPVGDPPTKLKTQDCLVGDGETVTDTAVSYNWNYEGVSWATGKVFDSSFERGAPIAFSLNQVIPGWTDGLQGMKVGGRRMLVIPPADAYGAAGSPPAIGPNETLVFVVDLVGKA